MNPRVITQLAVATALLLAGAAAAKAEPHNMTPLAPAITQHLPRGPEPEPQDLSRRR